MDKYLSGLLVVVGVVIVIILFVLNVLTENRAESRAVLQEFTISDSTKKNNRRRGVGNRKRQMGRLCRHELTVIIYNMWFILNL